jgi:hypothetical protein
VSMQACDGGITPRPCYLHDACCYASSEDGTWFRASGRAPCPAVRPCAHAPPHPLPPPTSHHETHTSIQPQDTIPENEPPRATSTAAAGPACGPAACRVPHACRACMRRALPAGLRVLVRGQGAPTHYYARMTVGMLGCTFGWVSVRVPRVRVCACAPALCVLVCVWACPL